LVFLDDESGIAVVVPLSLYCRLAATPTSYGSSTA
jgi:hypothetical protein